MLLVADKVVMAARAANSVVLQRIKLGCWTLFKQAGIRYTDFHIGRYVPESTADNFAE